MLAAYCFERGWAAELGKQTQALRQPRTNLESELLLESDAMLIYLPAAEFIYGRNRIAQDRQFLARLRGGEIMTRAHSARHFSTERPSCTWTACLLSIPWHHHWSLWSEAIMRRPSKSYMSIELIYRQQEVATPLLWHFLRLNSSVLSPLSLALLVVDISYQPANHYYHHFGSVNVVSWQHDCLVACRPSNLLVWKAVTKVTY